MKILITGVTGFIGRHLAKNLILNNPVYGATRDKATTVNPEIETVCCDFKDPLWVSNLPNKVDCVIHLAQSSQYRNFPGGVVDMRRINIDATCELLEWSRVSGVKHFIFTSSANVYGSAQSLLTEDHPTAPNSFYGASKLAAEHITRQYGNCFQVDILRLFTVYGPRQREMLIPNIIERVRFGQEVTLSDSVGLFLTPVYVEDVARIISELITFGAGVSPRIFNLCGDTVVTLAEIVECLEGMLGKKAAKAELPGPALSITGCNKALKSFLGPIKFTDLKNGLSNTLAHQLEAGPGFPV
jgi:nucleoside-diphosphate-sugar epimerase